MVNITSKVFVNKKNNQMSITLPRKKFKNMKKKPKKVKIKVEEIWY